MKEVMEGDHRIIIRKEMLSILFLILCIISVIYKYDDIYSDLSEDNLLVGIPLIILDSDDEE